VNIDAIVGRHLADSIAAKEAAVTENRQRLAQAAALLTDALAAGYKMMLFGNGGSAADAQHLAAEFVNRFVMERPPLAAMALATDTSILTSIGNDYSFEDIFAKQIRALGRKNDVAIGISTSGNSPNVVAGFEAARALEMHTIAMTGSGGKVAALADLTLTVPVGTTARIQEAHIFMGHILCDLVDRHLFPEQLDT